MSKKYRIEIEETIKFNHMLQIIVDDGVDINKVINELEKNGNYPDDIIRYLNNNGVKILDFDKDEDGKYSFEVPICIGAIHS